MGRVQLSTQYGIDDAPQPKSSSYPHPPRFIDAPFDLDADADAPDVVYEAFLTPEQLRASEERTDIAIVQRESAPSPVESIESDETSSDETTQPSTRVPSPVRQDRGSHTLPRADSPADRGLRVLELMEPLDNARAAALPAIRAAIAEGATEPRPLVLRLAAILRPHITAALAPFITELPEASLLGHIYERSLLFEVLHSDPASPFASGFPRNEILAAVNAAEEVMFENGRTRNTASTDEGNQSDFGDDLTVESDDEDLRTSDLSRDVDPGSTPPSSLTDELRQWWRSRNPDDLQLDAPHRVEPAPDTARPSLTLQSGSSITHTSHSNRPQFMDMDPDEDVRSTSSSTNTGFSATRYRSPAFAPRVFRAQDLLGRANSLIPDVARDPYMPLPTFLPAEPLR
ncbi:hypothetical protein FRB99_001189 [Tulasnella sp. 403]|nr:hypothetical protein FRB99_001189 [Tulasnella sp. 403]